jgi:dipeptidyl aminopeptidase/acylaminoacyl peptidase
MFFLCKHARGMEDRKAGISIVFPALISRCHRVYCRNVGGSIVGAMLLAALSPASHSQSAMTPSRALDYRRVGDLHLSPDGSALSYVMYSYQWDWQPHLWLMEISSGNARELTPAKKAERSPEWSPDGKSLAFLSNREGKTQVYVSHADGSEAAAVTSRKYGVSSFHWSPDARSIAYLAKDDSAPGSDTGPQVADRDSDLSRLWITDTVSGVTRAISKAGVRIDEFQWRNPSELLLVAADQPRVEQHNDAVYSISIQGDTVRLIGRPPQPFRGLVVSPDGKQFAVRSTRTAGPDPRDLFAGTIGLDDLRDISAPPDRSVAEVKWHSRSAIWVRVVDGFRNRIWRLSENGAPPAPVDLALSVDSFDVSRDGTLVFAGGDFDHFSEIYLKGKSGSIRQLTHLHEDHHGIRLASTKIFQTRSFDGTLIESALMRPANARAGEKLPLVLLVHGGPSSNFAANYSWDTAWAQLLAAHGYLVLLVNPRGSNGYSEDFMKANRGDLGGGDYRDLIAVLDGVIAAGDADPDRLGIGGWSYGGEMTAWATTQTNRFKAAVAGAPVFDQQAEFETEEGPADDEWHFGTPWEHPEVFAHNSPSTYIGHAHTPTLILDGEEDASNPVGQSKGLYRALKHLGVETEMVLYPGEGHSPRNGSYNVDMFERILKWYDRFLKASD